MLVSNCT